MLIRKDLPGQHKKIFSFTDSGDIYFTRNGKICHLFYEIILPFFEIASGMNS